MVKFVARALDGVAGSRAADRASESGGPVPPPVSLTGTFWPMPTAGGPAPIVHAMPRPTPLGRALSASPAGQGGALIGPPSPGGRSSKGGVPSGLGMMRTSGGGEAPRADGTPSTGRATAGPVRSAGALLPKTSATCPSGATGSPTRFPLALRGRFLEAHSRSKPAASGSGARCRRVLHSPGMSPLLARRTAAAPVPPLLPVLASLGQARLCPLAQGSPGLLPRSSVAVGRSPPLPRSLVAFPVGSSRAVAPASNLSFLLFPAAPRPLRRPASPLRPDWWISPDPTTWTSRLVQPPVLLSTVTAVVSALSPGAPPPGWLSPGPQGAPLVASPPGCPRPAAPAPCPAAGPVPACRCCARCVPLPCPSAAFFACAPRGQGAAAEEARPLPATA